MLVAMLRADGIAANMALLDTGPGADVDAGAARNESVRSCHCLSARRRQRQ